nr:putative galacturonosyltransferase 4 [Quercus suber]
MRITFDAPCRADLLENHRQFYQVGPRPLVLESATTVKEPIRIVYSDTSTKSLPNSDDLDLQDTHIAVSSQESRSTRVLSTTNEEEQDQRTNLIREVTDSLEEANDSNEHDTDTATHMDIGEDTIDADDQADQSSDNASQNTQNMEIKDEQQSTQTSSKVKRKERIKSDSSIQNDQTAMPDTRVRQLKDQIIRAKVYLSLPATRNNPHFTRELRGWTKEVQRVLGDVRKDSELPRNAYDKLKAMEQTLAKGKQLQDDCASVVKKLRAMLHSTKEQLRVHKKQTIFLIQLTAKTIPKGLPCLPLRLTTEYYTLNSSQHDFPNQEKLEDPQLYHHVLFSDNILAAAVVVNSTITYAKEPLKHVFHIVTDRLNYAAMRMWFLVNPPGKASIQVQNIEEFTWLNASYSPVLKQLGSQSTIELDYYFRAHRANSDSNLKYRNPKYLSILNHLQFYLPEIFPKFNKVLFLDDDIVVKKDLTALWSLDLKGNVNGAVETCGESFHCFDRNHW